MKIVDTNVIVGLLTSMTPAQREFTESLLLEAQDSEHPLIITEGVFIETEWVLRRRYRLPRREIATMLQRLLDTAAFEAWDAPLATLALKYMYQEPRMDAVDCVLCARDVLGEGLVVTFDKLLSRTLRDHYKLSSP